MSCKEYKFAADFPADIISFQYYGVFFQL